ncbi:hypothetical protein GOBAR_AA02539 [Gossypium barbadense]|uniref:Uncharacterized protein n=1 Tax=Gossypium barbadense TaxID=3634 RepID=A0A2P5YR24_GOSBA|nr:hypothetical protein GOBAR_AA02539 [Gossypium barbadense]
MEMLGRAKTNRSTPPPTPTQTIASKASASSPLTPTTSPSFVSRLTIPSCSAPNHATTTSSVTNVTTSTAAIIDSFNTTDSSQPANLFNRANTYKTL